MRRGILWRRRSRRRLSYGTLQTIRGVQSPQLGNRRDIHVHLPASYQLSDRRYPVVYMHDGQNLFDPKTSFAEPWKLDDAMHVAARRGVEAIVVALPNMGKQRIDEYSPFVDSRAGGGKGDLYVEWITESVKPLIDTRYRTRDERAATAIAGSSMGGLISLYAFFRERSVFGRAAVLSPALWFAGGAIFPVVERAAFAPGRIYLDGGGREPGSLLDNVRRMRDVLVAKGYRVGDDLRIVEDPEGGHREADWGRRFGEALHFLVG